MKVTPDLGINFYCLFKLNKISFFEIFFCLRFWVVFVNMSRTHMRIVRELESILVFVCFSIWYYIVYVLLWLLYQASKTNMYSSTFFKFRIRNKNFNQIDSKKFFFHFDIFLFVKSFSKFQQKNTYLFLFLAYF